MFFSLLGKHCRTKLLPVNMKDVTIERSTAGNI